MKVRPTKKRKRSQNGFTVHFWWPLWQNPSTLCATPITQAHYFFNKNDTFRQPTQSRQYSRQFFYEAKVSVSKKVVTHWMGVINCRICFHLNSKKPCWSLGCWWFIAHIACHTDLRHCEDTRLVIIMRRSWKILDLLLRETWLSKIWELIRCLMRGRVL